MEVFIGSEPRDATIESLAQIAAEAHYRLQQVRTYRQAKYVEQGISVGEAETRFADLEDWINGRRKVVAELERLDHYERRALSRRRRALRDLGAYLAVRDALR
jgi:hypothetical protein